MNRLSLAAVLLLTTSAAAQACHDLQGLTAVAQDLLVQFPTTGNLCLRVDQRGSTVYEAAFGTFTLAQVVPIASATKTLSAAVLMSLVDDGVLALDDRVGTYLPEWNTGAKATITLRMCFTHTAGLPSGDPAISDNSITLRQAAQQLAAVPLDYAPGTAFEYGGVSMQVAGAVCEVAAGLPWAQLFQQRLAGPLQMTATDYYAFGPTQNPRIAGGARTNLHDQAAFMNMLRQNGAWNGGQVLSAASIAAMLTDQTSTLPVISTPHPEGAPYGIGIWLDRRDSQGRTVWASADGAFGFSSWIDRAHDAIGVFLVRNLFQQTFPYLRRCWDECDAALLPDGVACLGSGSPACANGTWLNATRPSVALDADFVLLTTRAPAAAFGAMVLGSAIPLGVPLGDLLDYVDLGGAVLVPLVADGAGRAVLRVPLLSVSTGQQFTVQGVWLSPNGCAVLGLQSSHALQLSILAP